MGDEKNKMLGTVAELVKAVPVYQDLAQPAAREIGKNLETVAKATHMALAPLRGLIWTWDKFEDFIKAKVSRKLECTKEEDIVTPDPKTVIPALEAVRYTSDDDIDLQEMYASLIAKAMDKNTQEKTHPAYASIIKSFSTDDALVIKYFKRYPNDSAVDMLYYIKSGSNKFNIVTECMSCVELNCKEIKDHERILKSIKNFTRLGIIERSRQFANNESYTHEEEYCKNAAALNGFDINKIKFERYSLKVTAFGKGFLDTVVS